MSEVNNLLHKGCFSKLITYFRQKIRPFQLKRKIRRGKFKNESKGGFSGGAQRTLACARRRGLFCSAISLKMGSSGVVKLYQKTIFFGDSARMGGFFCGFAKQNPNATGGRNFRGSRRLRLFGF